MVFLLFVEGEFEFWVILIVILVFELIVEFVFEKEKVIKDILFLCDGL